MADIDVASPSDTDVVSNFPAEERASRAALLDALNGAATWGGTSGGTANVQTVTVDLTGWALTSGATVDFIAGFSNTATMPTFKVNSTTAKTVVSKTGGALVASDIVVGRLHSVRYDGTNWRLLDPAISNSSAGMSQTVYDLLFPVNAALQITNTTTTPVVPAGITATWTRQSTDAYLRITSSSIASGGSLATGGSGILTTGDNSALHGVSAAGSTPVAEHTHTHNISSHTHTIEPTYTSKVLWLRTA